MKPSLKSIRSGIFSRGFSLARMSVNASVKAAGYAAGNLFGSESEKAERFKAMLMGQVESLAKELGELKGSLMKVGQAISMYGEYFLPPEVNKVLKSLQSESPPLEWKAIEKVLSRHLGKEKLAELEIESDPIASASLGQVHRARRKSDGRLIALKIQYPGVDKAIDGDIRALRSIFSVMNLLPTTHNFDEIFKEVRTMLHQEVDYVQELEMTRKFRELLVGDDRYIVPEVFPEYSTKRVLATSYEEGVRADHPSVQALPLDRRNAIGVAFIDLFYQEFYSWHMVQTDPHFGNYLVQVGQGGAPDKLVLFDFGAVRSLDLKFFDPYYLLIQGCYYQDRDRFFEGAKVLGFIRDEDPEESREIFYQLCRLFLEPFDSADTPYDWGTSDLPKRLSQAAGKMVLAFRLRPPPRENVFLDRKMGGVFIFLSTLKVKIIGRDILQKYL